MIFLYIYIGFSVLAFAMMYIQVYTVYKKLERQYPDIVAEYNKRNKRGTLEKILSFIRNLVTCFVPIMNISIFYVALFENKKVEERALNEMMKE